MSSSTAAHSTPDELIFVFDGGTDLDPQKDHHIHGVKITFPRRWQGHKRLGRLLRGKEGWNRHVRDDSAVESRTHLNLKGGLSCGQSHGW